MNKVIGNNKKLYLLIFGIGFLLVGLIILGISSFTFFNPNSYKGKATAVISIIDKERIENVDNYDKNVSYIEKYENTVYVDYTVEDKEYKNVGLDSYASSMKVGDKVEINYDINDPSKIKIMSSKTFTMVFISIGILITLFGIYSTYKGFKIK